jgi:hypothetical protein
MGIALPTWVVEAQNSGWVLGVYGLVFGLGLPYLVVGVADALLGAQACSRISGRLAGGTARARVQRTASST